MKLVLFHTSGGGAAGGFRLDARMEHPLIEKLKENELVSAAQAMAAMGAAALAQVMQSPRPPAPPQMAQQDPPAPARSPKALTRMTVPCATQTARGVSRMNNGLWQVKIKINGADKVLAYYSTQDAAARLYDVVSLNTRQVRSAYTNSPRASYDEYADDIKAIDTSHEDWVQHAKAVSLAITLASKAGSGVRKCVVDGKSTWTVQAAGSAEVHHFSTADAAMRFKTVLELVSGGPPSDIYTFNRAGLAAIKPSDKDFIEKALAIAALKKPPPMGVKFDGNVWEAHTPTGALIGTYSTEVTASAARDIYCIRQRGLTAGAACHPPGAYTPYLVLIFDIDLFDARWREQVSRAAELYAADITEERMQEHMQIHQGLLKRQAEAYASFLSDCTKALPTEQSTAEKQCQLELEEKAEMSRIQQLVLDITAAETQEQVNLSAALEESSSKLKRICTSRSELSQQFERSKRVCVEIDQESRRIRGFLNPMNDV